MKVRIMPSDKGIRCPWAEASPDYQRYHDEEWGRPLYGDQALFERLSLEAFQSGLSWITILRKRPAFREAFANFHIETVAAFTDTDVQRLLANAGIVRNERKIRATINNAQRLMDLPGQFETLLWSFAPQEHHRPYDIADIPTQTAESQLMARTLKKAGFRFVGPVTCYALMQATGMVDDHISICFRARA